MLTFKLQPVDFTRLKPQSRSFLKELLAQVFISTQISTPIDSKRVPQTGRNRGAVEEVFIKATRTETLAMGLVYFLGQAFRDEEDIDAVKLVRWAAEVAKETLRVGLDVIPSL